MADSTEMQDVKVTSPAYPGYPPQQQPQQYGYPPAQTTVVPAPQVITVDRSGQGQGDVQDNMVIAIVSVFFCFILGIIAIVKANKAKEHLMRGDVDSARRDSRLARQLAIAGIAIGLGGVALLIFLFFILPLIGFGIVAASSGY
ncbi:hypothetical protein RRG08_006955 [Elysia crispata]|uniref:Interferon-induced transmembrane protein n=1 Tax=Elysia crispata TaxID=231223 RepID=A0AAE0XRX7_9GAST|nr:hypothetical protein RRG08_006955 [Elysia crispata]